MVSIKLDQLFSFSSQHHAAGFQRHALAWAQDHPIIGVLTLLTLVALASPVAILLFYGSQGLYRYIRLNVFKMDPYQHLPRPKVPFTRWTLFAGDLTELGKEPFGVKGQMWVEECGQVFAPRGLFYRPALQLIDPVAMAHVLGSQHAYSFPKPTSSQEFLLKLLGPGLVSVEGNVHKHQRRIVSPAFSTTAIKDLTPLFFRHANRIRKRFEEMVDQTTGPAKEPMFPGQTPMAAQESKEKQPVIDVSFWLSRTTLDVIGDAGFDEQFNTIEHVEGDEPHDLAAHFKYMLKSMTNINLTSLLIFFVASKLRLGWLVERIIPEARARKTANDKMRNLSLKVIERKKRQLVGEKGAGHAALKKSDLDEADGKKVDILHLLMRANMSSDIKESERLSDDELIGQMCTMIFAGHETTATQLGWILLALSQDHALQKRLRDEVNEYMVGRDELGYEELHSMPLLEAVVKEILRLIPPVHATARSSAEDCVIPLSKDYKTQDGKGTFNSIALRKGQDFGIPIYSLNTSKDIWGPDALEFKPERWFDLPETVKQAGFPMELMTFLAGPRACIGNRLSFTETKAILAVLVANFKFDKVPGWETEKKQAIVTSPRIIGQENHGIQLPLLVSRA